MKLEGGLRKREPRNFCVLAMSACRIDAGSVREMSEGLFSGLKTSLYWSRVLVTGPEASLLLSRYCYWTEYLFTGPKTSLLIQRGLTGAGAFLLDWGPC